MKSEIYSLDDLSVWDFELPHTGFDPLIAKAEELHYHGFPERPDEKIDPMQFAAWQRIFSRWFTHKTPAFTALTPQSMKVEAPQESPPMLPQNQYSYNWSGAAWEIDADPTHFITATWNVPNPHLPRPGAQGLHNSEAFIGIGGWNKKDGQWFTAGIQLGTEQSITAFGPGDPSIETYAYWRIFTNQIIRIDNLLVNPGDLMYGVIGINKRYAKRGLVVDISLANLSSKEIVSFAVNYPSGILFGGSAEWIVSRFGDFRGSLSEFPNFGAVYFDDATANTRSRKLIEPKDSYNINISLSHFLSYGYILADRTVRCMYNTDIK